MEKKNILKIVRPMVIVSAAVAVTALSGCQMSCNGPYTYVLSENVYIVYNNTLHKGDVIVNTVYGEGPHPTPEIHTHCGLNRGTSLYVSSSQKPQESEYEFVCEDCFGH